MYETNVQSLPVHTVYTGHTDHTYYGLETPQMLG